jgi:coenzyme F420 hydrogenase subunit beta
LNIFGRQPDDAKLGNYISCFVGYSRNTKIRHDSASGGLASQILISALEAGVIDGALVTRMRSDRPLETEAFIARNKDEILESARSKYCPVTLGEGLRTILKSKGRYAFVGLPCHIHGIRKFERINKTVRERIVLHVGLMCAHTLSYNGTEFLLEKFGIERKQVKDIAYRGNGWPGSMNVKTNAGAEFSVPLMGSWKAYWSPFSCFFFTPSRCLTCVDQTNELADVSLGDAWLPELNSDEVGTSIIVTRTEIAEVLLRRMASEARIYLKEVSCHKVEQSQALNLKYKKGDIKIRLRFLQMVGQKIPEYRPDPTFSGVYFIAFARNLFPLFNAVASSNPLSRRVLKNIPFALFRIYFGIYKYLCMV